MALISTNIIAQNQSVEWTRQIDNDMFNHIFWSKVYQNKMDNAYYFNRTHSERYGPDGNPIQYGILTKVNSDGTISWNKEQDNLRHLDFIMTNKELITLSSPFDQTSSQTFNVYKYNLNGHLITSIPINVTHDVTLANLVLTNDNNYLLAGQKVDLQFEKVKVYLMKVNKKGQKVWEKVVGNVDDNVITSITSSKNGDIFFSGYIYNNSQENPTNLEWVVKLSNKGDIIWSKVSTVIHPEINKVIVTSSKDGGCITLTTSLDGIAKVSKYDKNGNQQWVKSFDSDYSSVKFYPSNIFEDNSKIIFGGIFENNNESKIEVLYLDQNGNLLNDFTLGIKEPSYYMNAIFSSTNNNGLIILDKDYNGIINLTKVGKPNTITYNATNAVKISPNPASDYINIQNLLGKNTISIRNTNGYEVIRKETNSPNEKISIRNLAKGVYYIFIDGEYNLSNYKIIKK